MDLGAVPGTIVWGEDGVGGGSGAGAGGTLTPPRAQFSVVLAIQRKFRHPEALSDSGHGPS